MTEAGKAGAGKQVKKPIMFVFDIEPVPQHAVTGSRDEWDHFPAFVARINASRGVFRERTGHPLRICWALRIDDQMDGAYGSPTLLVDQFAEILNDLENRGDEIGFHPHAYRWDGQNKRWFSDYMDEPWLLSRLDVWLDAYQTALGKPPAFIKFGDHWLSEAVTDWVDRKGIRFDVTVEPGKPRVPTVGAAKGDIGLYPDYTMALRHPYRPAHGDFLASGGAQGRRLWIIPIPTRCMTVPLACDGRAHSDHAMEPLNLSYDPAWLKALIDAELWFSPFVEVVGRTGDAFNPSLSDRFWHNWDYILAHPQTSDFVAAGPRAVVRSFFLNRRRDRAGHIPGDPSTAPSATNELRRELRRAYDLIEERTSWAQRLDAEIEERRQQIQELQQLVAERTNWAQRLDAEVVERRQQIRELQPLDAERTTSAEWLKAELGGAAIRARELMYGWRRFPGTSLTPLSVVFRGAANRLIRRADARKER